MSLVGHEQWRNIAPFLRIETYDRDGGHAHPRHRIEASDNDDPKLRAFLLSVTMPCVACGSEIHPVRERNGRPGLFVSVTCPLAESIGCARGAAASREYRNIINALVKLGYHAMLKGEKLF